jgi:hypothetical protein
MGAPKPVAYTADRCGLRQDQNARCDGQPPNVPISDFPLDLRTGDPFSGQDIVDNQAVAVAHGTTREPVAGRLVHAVQWTQATKVRESVS